MGSAMVEGLSLITNQVAVTKAGIYLISKSNEEQDIYNHLKVHAFTQPLQHKQDVTQGQFLSRVQLV